MGHRFPPSHGAEIRRRPPSGVDFRGQDPIDEGYDSVEAVGGRQDSHPPLSRLPASNADFRDRERIDEGYDSTETISRQPPPRHSGPARSRSGRRQMNASSRTLPAAGSKSGRGPHLSRIRMFQIERDTDAAATDAETRKLTYETHDGIHDGTATPPQSPPQLSDIPDDSTFDDNGPRRQPPPPPPPRQAGSDSDGDSDFELRRFDRRQLENLVRKMEMKQAASDDESKEGRKAKTKEEKKPEEEKPEEKKPVDKAPEPEKKEEKPPEDKAQPAVAAAPGAATPDKPAAPGAPDKPAAPGASATPDKPATPGAPATPAKPGAPAPATPVKPGAPGAPAAATPVKPGAPGAPATPTKPAAPGAPATPTKPAAPGAPATPTKPAAPGAPVTPTKPAAPGAPATPTKPGAPATPAKPGAPATPATPAKPGAPATPATPAKPGAPATPATPAKPGAPATPATPAKPGAPATPAKPGAPATPTKPGAPATPATPATAAAPAPMAGPPLDVKVPVVFVFGGPGSGKGTQCDKIVAKYGFTHISSGDLLRAEVASGSDRGKQINDIMKAGELAPLDMILQLIKETIQKDLPTAKGFLLDGYPRNVEQGERFESDVCKCTNLIYFEVSDDTMHARLLKRGQTSGRVDDNEATIVKRIKTFHDESEPVLDKYKDIVHKISAEGDPDKVFASVTALMDKMIKPK
ncbi:hypothetical protein MTO96_020965 [Rhipicephalus appendiculatus]